MREEHRWRLLLSAGRGFGIEDPAGGLISACVLTDYGPAEQPVLSTVGMLLVAERYARRGIGRRLMEYVVEESAGTPLTLHATPTGSPLYEQLGFLSTGRAATVKGRFAPAGLAPGPATRPAVAGDLPAILRLDTEVSGLDRTHLLTRLPAFADQLRVAEDDGDLIGYAALWPNSDSHVVGPLIARDTATAQALVASFATGTDRPLRSDIDVRHEELLAWLHRSGLETVAHNTVMTRGIPEPPGDPARRFAPLTLAAG